MDSTTEDGGVVVALPTIDHDDSEASSNQDHIMEGENSGSTTTLSKNAQKRILRDQRRLEAKADRKAREKAMRAEKRKEKKRLAQDEGILEETRLYKKPRLGLGKKNAFNARVVIDLGFDDKMSDKEVHSLCSQLSFTYAANRRASVPFSSILFTSINGKTLQHLDGPHQGQFRSWKGVHWWEDGYDRLWGDPVQGIGREASGAPERCERDKVIYLSADAEDEIEELKEGETYIIGGLVDHNRYKGICERKANDDGVRSARLPIGKYLTDLSTRKVLTVNQVYEILLKWLETKSWEVALREVVPKRKFKTRERNGAVVVGEDNDQDEVEGEIAEDGRGATVPSPPAENPSDVP